MFLCCILFFFFFLKFKVTKPLIAICLLCALGTFGSWCISGSIWGLRRGKRTTMSPRRRRYCCPPAMCTTFSWTTSLRIITAAVSRRVSVRMLSAERKGQQSGWCQKGASMSLNQLCPKAWEVKMFPETPELNKISIWNKGFFSVHVSRCLNPVQE